jgi:protein-S-isoprenylcysteine O-methyltransferase Ste14
MLSSTLLITLTGLAFGLLHTALASLRLKDWARRRWGLGRVDRWYRLFFSLAAIITFLPLLTLPRVLPDRPLYAIPAPLVWLTGALQLAAGGVFLVALAQTDVWRFVGLRQLLRGGAPIPADRHERLVTSGPYRWVRHPLYSATLLILWLWPAMSLNQLTFVVVCTAYFYLGSIPEEQKLLQEFGAAYRRYQRVVPRLVPRPGRVYRPD